MQAFSNTAGLELLAMLQHAPPTARPQQATSQPLPQHQSRPTAPPKPAQPTANAMPAVFPAPSDQEAGENSAGLHLMSLLGISGATGAPVQQQRQQPQQPQQRVQAEEPEEEQIVFGGFFAKQQAAARPPVVPAAAPNPEKKDNVAPSSALFKSRGQRPAAAGEVGTIRKANARGPMVRLAKGPDGTIGFHAGRMAAGLPVVYIGTPSTRSTSPPSPRRSMDATHEGVRGASAKKNRKNDPFHRTPHHGANSGYQHRSPLKSCGNTGRDDSSHWRPTQPVFA